MRQAYRRVKVDGVVPGAVVGQHLRTTHDTYRVLEPQSR